MKAADLFPQLVFAARHIPDWPFVAVHEPVIEFPVLLSDPIRV
jgi:hypothetical protein